ncbi:MAG: galactose-1-phosphate uridylyltransferase [Candidatus Buchananbacteria bacterium RIFCSPHIGHO2_02_FULL_45_11b]|uniref:Galactose-1-phosphate uridylyltransferase n=3 Tax=Candidatus Buchananiibacteriota TaxID=1817903 RepID=A0A1G1YLS7_9BACT|nr:MAG: galactose-1-phosphate uridylyltransferase [Candidatus Buchananbacteria bacterium RIFCSPHIGHO2_01_FULL_46_12]OGY50766.1 MAG: galactose-1-phosphate uridylyltransferase [Candidatus Buchananbacteria bacterium RIFCSPHIGHO2_02_FULL_45_11b]OGY53313.1 MAG: galactose-1-phosphate uridylyltransferase [Candidatus Buchananbacteria bacterium RIFCSPLOWO2_01_FULL_45_31]
MLNSEIRKDYIQEKYVIISPRRGKRPHDVPKPAVSAPGAVSECVFCPGQIDQVSKVLLTVNKTKEKKEPWAIKVIANKFPSVSPNNPRAYGRQQVVIETPDHLKEIEELSTVRVAQILEVYSRQTKEISRDKKIEYVLIFKNNGGRAGASLQHAHSQIFATQFLPPHIKDKCQRVQAYKLERGGCVYCDVIKSERKGPRLIAEDKNMIVFCPYAPMHNYEVWIMPKRHLDNVTLLNQNERLSFAKFLKKVLLKINQLNLPYNYYFHQVINDKDQHLYVKITPRGSVWAGVEIGSGLIINPVAPEDAAEFYRE